MSYDFLALAPLTPIGQCVHLMSQGAARTRPAIGKDEAAVFAIDTKTAAGDWDRRQYLSMAIDAGECIVCERAGQVLGFAVMKRRHFYGRDFIDLLFVAPEARRQGIGRSLMRASVRTATTARVFTSTNRSNSPMQALLRSERWSWSGELDGLDQGDPELVYYRSR